MDEIRGRGLDPVLREAAERGTPLLGICIGMQVLFEESEEHGRHQGLGLLPGRVRRFEGALPVPHMGWNRLRRRSRTRCSTGWPTASHVYFVHSYFCDAPDDVVLAHLRLRPRLPGGGRPRQRARRAVPSREEPGRGPAHARQLRAPGRVRAEERRTRVIVVPAIDIRGGKVVRLKQGRLEDETVYGTAPADVARRWEAGGRARASTSWTSTPPSSRKPQRDVVAAVIAAVKIPVEVGGGLRVLENAHALSRARRRPRDLRHRGGGPARAWCRRRCGSGPRRWRSRSTPSNGKVAVAGWNEVTTVDAVDLAADA